MAQKNNYLQMMKRMHFKRQIIIQDRKRLIMEGCDKVLACDENEIVLSGEHIARIIGKKLSIEELGNQNMAVSGIFDCIRFEDIKND